ncbi:hypothetical protein [Cryptosporangium minutisporangium]|uniref:DUF2637 domain-containing protein n=1 Tax=Cryptosporangium minutisporangium TaxID=113569 RepID=A0ABP6SW43_9ACTN
MPPIAAHPHPDLDTTPARLTESTQPTVSSAPAATAVHPESESRSADPTDPGAPTGHAVQRAAWIFYFIAALGSAIGQIWVGVDAPPWPPHIAWWWRTALVTPFAVVIDLGGVVSSAFADYRQRLGETAYGWRALSAGSVTLAVSINILGHRPVAYLSAVFGGMGVFAYTVWLLHSAARRRDALRAAGKLPGTAPVYGLRQWAREPAVTNLARTLALAHNYTRQESLDLARQQLDHERRRASLTQYIDALIRAQHADPIRAAIAVTTLDIDALAAALTARADVEGWARLIGADLLPPAPDDPPATDESRSGAARGPMPPADVLRRVPQDPASYQRWRQLWARLAADPSIRTATFAARHDISPRQVQWIRAVGLSGLLDSPIPLLDRVAALAVRPDANGHAADRTDASNPSA